MNNIEFTKPETAGIVHDSTELRNLISKYPDLPIAILSKDDSCIGDGVFTYMSEVKCYVGELLDCYLIHPEKYYGDDYERVFDDRLDFKEYLENVVCDIYDNASYDEQTEIIEKYLKLYEPYWKKCIIVKAFNE